MKLNFLIFLPVIADNIEIDNAVDKDNEDADNMDNIDEQDER